MTPGRGKDTAAEAPARIPPAELRVLLDTGFRGALLDVREVRDVEAGHLLGATNLPRRNLELRIQELVPLKSTPIVVYDGDGGLGTRAADDLAAVGYRDVRVLDGGLAAWTAAGEHVATGRNVPSKAFGELVQHHDDIPMVTPTKLAAWFEAGQDVLVVDVRTAEEHARETIPGSVHVPGFELPVAIDELAGPNTKVVVHCSGRTRSIIGARTLGLTGRSGVLALENGTMGWVLAGLEPDRAATRTYDRIPDRAPQQVARVWRRHSRSVGVRFLKPAGAAAGLERAPHLERTVQLFDVRTEKRFLAGHAPGATSVPSGQLVQQPDDHIAVADATTMLICDDGVRSAIAGYWLRRMGAGDVVVVDGGMAAWKELGMPVETGRRDLALGLEQASELTPLAPADLLALDEDERPTLWSVDPSPVHATAHPTGSRWISATWLERDLESLAGDVRGAVVFNSADGVRAQLAACKAHRAGWTRATWLDGGTAAWREVGGAIGSGLPSDLDPDDAVHHPITVGHEAMQAYLDWEQALAEDDD